MRSIHISRVYEAPVEAVWEALTDSHQIAEWLMPNDFQPTLGHEFTFRTAPAPGFDGVVRCKVLCLEAPRKLQYSWKGGGIETVATFELERCAAGTRLTFRQDGFAGMRSVMPRIMLGFGWENLLGKKLPALLERRAQSGTPS
jgi:uncharacterized protein YndB with AHSA1/START domain